MRKSVSLGETGYLCVIVDRRESKQDINMRIELTDVGRQKTEK